MEKLLIVDDDAAMRRLMRLQLNDLFDVIDTGEPQEGLALALEHKPAVILVDLRMPKYSGYELLQTFTTFSHTQNIPVIIVSGEAGGHTKMHCQQLGAFDYFEKPIDFDSLRKRLGDIGKNVRFVPRAEVRVRLHVPLTLRGIDNQGRNVDQETTTENVSLTGFLCPCSSELSLCSVVEVYLKNQGGHYVGKAKVIHSKLSPTGHCGFVFTEKAGSWVLQ